MDARAIFAAHWGTTPAESVRLALGRAREGGAPFGNAWAAALTAVGADEQWRPVLIDTQEGWRRAYERGPQTDAERALSDLVRRFGLEDAELADLTLHERVCAHCGEPIPPGAALRTVYCSVRCRRDAAYERERALADGRKDAEAEPPSVLPTARECVGITYERAQEAA